MEKTTKPQGTPKSLREALSRGLSNCEDCPRDAQIDVLILHIKDYFSQKFSAALILEWAAYKTNTVTSDLWGACFEANGNDGENDKVQTRSEFAAME